MAAGRYAQGAGHIKKRALELPSPFDIHEWAIMEQFAQKQRNERARQDLLHAIHAAGAFRAFKNAIHLLGIEQSWYKFRGEALAQIARDWLEEHNFHISNATPFMPLQLPPENSVKL